jgi:imidazolonepropionase-like amidohydrolase
VAVRDRINRGEAIGSRMFIGGHIIGFGGPYSADGVPTGLVMGPETVARINQQWEQGVGPDLMWLSAEGVRQRVRDYIERSSIDFIKYAGAEHIGPKIAFSDAAQRAIVEEAHRAGLTAQAHTYSVESLRMEVDAGCDLLQHPNLTGIEPIPDDLMKTIVDRQIPCAAMIWTKAFTEFFSKHGAAAMAALDAADIGESPLIAATEKNNQGMIDSGARLMLTTDAFYHSPRHLNHPWLGYLMGDAVDPIQSMGETHFGWLKAVTERGMAPMEALLAATRNIAEAYGQSAELGTLEKGKRADLVILDADPLGDAENYRRINTVMKDGAVVPRDELPTHPVLSELQVTP